MRFHNCEKLKQLMMPMETVRLIAKINEYKGKQDLYEQQAPQILNSLKEAAVIQSTKASNAVEVGRYISLEKIIEDSKEDYYETLRKSSDCLEIVSLLPREFKKLEFQKKKPPEGSGEFRVDFLSHFYSVY